jgi:hypothetical protein
MLRLAPLLAAALLVAGCASNRFEAQVTRFHQAPPAPGQSVAVVPLATGADASLEFRSQAAAVEAELMGAGFGLAPASSADLLAVLGVGQSFSEGMPRRSPVSVGIGGGTGGGNVGVGGSVAFPVGQPRGNQILRTEMTLALKRRADGQALWEGRAATTAEGRAPAPNYPLLARALLSGFPGPSGQTVRWVEK